MFGYMLEEQVDKDFALARRKALLGRIGARLRRDAPRIGSSVVGVNEVLDTPATSRR